MDDDTKPQQPKSVSEATLEARLAKFVAATFPGLAIDLQETFTIRLGHSDHAIGSKQTWAGGRADILIRNGGKPLAVIELKAPDESIDKDAVRQALSYARLVEPMAPLAIVTNGVETSILRSFDGAVVDTETFDEAAVAARFKDASQLAGAIYDDAVRDLLARDDIVFADLLRSASVRALDQMTGDVRDLTRPLCKEFSIPRTAVEALAESIHAGNRVTVLVGPALSGRTNVLAQLCARGDLTPIFVDAVAADHGPIRFMANVIAAKLFRSASEDTVRHWLLHRLQQPAAHPIAIVVDGWGGGSGERTRQDVSELIQLCGGNGIAIVTAIDEAWFESLATTGSGQVSAFGREAVRIDLDPLSQPEFATAVQLIAEDWNLHCDSGSQFNADYRQPRILRLLLAQKPLGSPPIIDEERMMMSITRVPTVTGPSLLDGAWERIANGTMRDDFLRFAKAFMEDESGQPGDPRAIMLIKGLGAISLQGAEAKLGEPRIKRLVDSGLASYLSMPDGDRFLYPRVPEILAKAAAIVIARDILRANINSEEEANDLYDMFIASCGGLPLPDVVGAAVLQELAHDNGDLLPWFIETMLEDRPNVTTIGDGATIIIRAPDGISEELEVPLGAGGPAIGNDLPFLILSQILALPMARNEVGDINVSLALEIGASPNFLLRVDERLQEWLGLETHDLPGGGSVVCPNAGVVEPVVNSIIQFVQAPQLRSRAPIMIEQMANYAAAEPPRPALALRLWTAFGVLETSVVESIAAAAAKARAEFLKPLFERLASDTHPNDR
ncbi:type I restriction endonuclease [Mesorhizobium argentiipisi]|uniref:Type I restriction enzyme HsdR N-terminal domain-containing protein n=1 Tax=Mesorhizobium argentiipisi TaxID=3015175 RepID=A0ABU8KAK7_9HYPH